MLSTAMWLQATSSLGMSRVVPSPCFSNFLARTTFVLESLPEAKNPGQDAIFGDFVFPVVILDIIADCDDW